MYFSAPIMYVFLKFPSYIFIGNLFTTIIAGIDRYCQWGQSMWVFYNYEQLFNLIIIRDSCWDFLTYHSTTMRHRIWRATKCCVVFREWVFWHLWWDSVNRWPLQPLQIHFLLFVLFPNSVFWKTWNKCFECRLSGPVVHALPRSAPRTELKVRSSCRKTVLIRFTKSVSHSCACSSQKWLASLWLNVKR